MTDEAVAKSSDAASQTDHATPTRSNLGERIRFFGSVVVAVLIDVAYLLIWALITMLAHVLFEAIWHNQLANAESDPILSVVEIVFQAVTGVIVVFYVILDAVVQIREILTETVGRRK